jgi:hypothetical protein
MQTTTTQASVIHRHMRTVIIVFAIVVAINIGVMSRFFVSKKPAKLNPLWNYISAQVQQAVLVDSKAMLDLLGDDLATISNNPLYTTLNTSKHIGLLQFGSGMVNQSSAILIDANKNFSVDGFLSSINMQDDTDYTFHKYSENIYVFGQPSTIDMLLDPSHTTLAQSDRFAAVQPLVAGKHVSFLSRVNPDATLDPTVSAFVAQTDMFVLNIVDEKSSITLNAHLLYTEPKDDIIAQDFRPAMTSYIDAQTIAYIETSLDGLWSAEEKETAIQALRAYDPVIFASIDDAQIASLMSENIAILAQNSPTFSDLRLALALNTPAAYSIIRGIFPLLQEPLAALAGLDPALLQAVEENDRISYQATLFGLIPLTLQSYIDKDNTILSLGTANKLTRNNIHKALPSPAKSIGYVFIQFDPLLQLYRQVSTMMGQSVQDPFIAQQEKLLQGKTRAGHLTVEADKVSLWSSIQ